MFGLADGAAVALLLLGVLIVGRMLRLHVVDPPPVDSPRVCRYLIEHKAGPWYVGWDAAGRLRLVMSRVDAVRYATQPEAEAVRCAFDEFRDTYHVVVIFDPEDRPDGAADA